MANAFPELPRADCPFSSALQAITLPMLPKPLWTGASSYSDPAYPHGGGPDDVPPAPPLMGQALPASNITPPTQTPLGGGSAGSVLGVIAGPCEPGPTTWKHIEVFDDGTWSAIDEPDGSILTGYILDRY